MTDNRWKKGSAVFLFTVICHLSSGICHAESREETLARVEHYLNALTTVKAEFTQIAPDGGISGGTFYLKRPGRMRWEYEPPVPILMIADGILLIYYDKELEQVTNIPLFDSLLSYLARDEIKLDDKDVTIDDVVSEAESVRITLHKTGSEDEGKLSLEFSDSPLQLRKMQITDAARQTTNVAFSDAQFGIELDKDLFIFHDPRKPRRRS